MEIENWQRGNESELTSLQRERLHSMWLNKIHEEIKNKLNEKKTKDEPKETLGFID